MVQGKGDVNPIDRARPGLIDQVGNGAQAATEVGGDVRAALRGPIVEKTHQLQTHLRRGFDVLGQLEAQFINADDGEPAGVITERVQGSLAVAGDASPDDHQHRRDGKPREHRKPRKLGCVLGDEGQSHEDQAGETPSEQRAHGLTMHRDAAPTPVHAGDLGQQTVDDDGHGGGNHVVLDAARKSTLVRQQQTAGDAQGVANTIPCPPY